MNESTESLCMKALERFKIDFRDSLSPRSARIVNKVFREKDDSSLWPIRGRFNATERAIRRLRRQDFGFSVLEYIYGLEAEISRIVNSEC